MKSKRKPVRNPKPIRWSGDAPAPAQAAGPVTNRRVANKPYKPAHGPGFMQRGPAAACPDDSDKDPPPELDTETYPGSSGAPWGAFEE